MGLALLQSQTQPVTVTPDRRGTAATAELYNEGGTQLGSTLTATLDTVSTTVASVGSTPDVLTLTSATGVQAGVDYWYTSVAGGWAAKVRVSSLAGNVVTLETPPPGTPAASDTFKGLVLSVSVPSTAVATRGRARLEWSITVGSETDIITQAGWIQRTKFRAAATPDDAKRMAYANFGAWARGEKPARWFRLAEEACTRVEEELTGNEDYPHLIADAARFRRAGDIALELGLAHLGRVPSPYDARAFVLEREDWLTRAVRRAVAGGQVDRNDNRTVEASEVVGLRNATIVRV